MARMPKTAWGYSTRIEQQYNNSLQRLQQQITSQLQGADSTAEISRRLREISNSPEFQNFAQNMAANMARQVYRESGMQWRRLAHEAGRRRGAAIYNALQNEINNTSIGGAISDIVFENTNWIKNLPTQLDAEFLSNLAMEGAFAGQRSESLIPDMIERFGEEFANRAKLIARTETAKAQSALTQARAQSMGLNWYIWRTARDGMRVRESHRHMEGVLVNWGDPPNPEAIIGKQTKNGEYHAGNIYNCRCYSEPVVDIGWLEFPVRVFHNGEIINMNRRQFESAA